MSYRSRQSKARRQRYTGSRQFSRGCRHGGACDRCRGDRTHRNVRRAPADADLREWSLTYPV